MLFAKAISVAVLFGLAPDYQPPQTQNLVQVQSNGFANWVANFRGRAAAQGINSRTFDAAFAGARYLPETVQKDRNQSEFVKPMSDYMGTAASDARVSNGREMMRKYAPLLARIEATYDVEPHIVVAFWGMESNYGARRGDIPLIIPRLLQNANVAM